MNGLRWLMIFPLAAALAACSGGGGKDSGDGEEKLKIAVIPKGTSNPFWKSVHAGAAKAEEELGNVEIIWVGPENEDDRRQQIDVVNNFIARRVDAIVLAPLDLKALVSPVEQAVSRGIPVIIIASALASDAQRRFTATDNVEGGRYGARRLGELMGGKGKAIMLRYQVNSASTENREKGFMEEMAAKFPDIEFLSTSEYAGVTRESAAQTATNLLNKYGGQVEGVFCPNESSTFGMLRALENTGKAGSIKFVGFDASAELIKGMEAGNIHGLVAQDPFDMGYKGVMTAVAVLEGKSVDVLIPTKLTLVTPENLKTEEIQALIAPELAGY